MYIKTNCYLRFFFSKIRNCNLSTWSTKCKVLYLDPLFKVCVVKRWNIYMHNPILKSILVRKTTWAVNAIWALSDFLYETYFFGFISKGMYMFLTWCVAARYITRRSICKRYIYIYAYEEGNQKSEYRFLSTCKKGGGN